MINNIKFLNSAADLPTFGKDQLMRNDSEMSEEVARGKLADGVEISYGDCTMIVERRALEDARKDVAEASPEERQLAMRSIQKALRKNLKIAEAEAKIRKATKELMDTCHSDIVLWAALQEYTS